MTLLALLCRPRARILSLCNQLSGNKLLIVQYTALAVDFFPFPAHCICFEVDLWSLSVRLSGTSILNIRICPRKAQFHFSERFINKRFRVGRCWE